MKTSKLYTFCLATFLSLFAFNPSAQAQFVPDEFFEICELLESPFSKHTMLRSIQICNELYESQPEQIMNCSLRIYEDARYFQRIRLICAPAAIVGLSILSEYLNSDH